MSKYAVILSGGLGIRLKPFTEVIPKPLLPIGEKAVLEIQIERLKKFGFDNIILATNYKSNYIENFFGDGLRYGVNLQISKEDHPLGTAGPIKLLADRLFDSFIVMNGDILSLIDYKRLYDFACSMDSLLTVSIKKIITPYAFGNILFEDLVTKLGEPILLLATLAGDIA
jgi:NDP-sugar pyrophosphorylase family protein